ncbi:MAG: nucleotidyltransferase family protein [Firmicutes bacterium]|nr:nucleotidyltransferase family protein [Bacillota bacterium]
MDAVILAAGTSSHFGSENKLLAEVSGKPMFLHITEILASLQRSSRIDEVVLVTNDPAIEDIVKRQYPLLRLVRNDHPEKGLALSMKLGILHLMRSRERIDSETYFERKRISEGCLFTVADQPYMTEETIRRLLNSWRLCGVCLEELLPLRSRDNDPIHGSARGPFANTAIAACEGSHGPCNPAVFSGCYYKEILDLPEEETGGRALLQRYKDQLCLVPAGDRELFDIDSKGDLDV